MQTTDWTELGREAHAMGLPRIPAADPAVAVTIADLAVGEGAADIMRAWGKGWDAANLAERVA